MNRMPKKIIRFKCKDCGKLIELGMCGEHREETDHKEFDVIYERKMRSKFDVTVIRGGIADLLSK